MNEATIRELLHLTARTTFVFFFCAFTGNALRDLWPGAFSAWLARKRDGFLLAQAASHTVHLAAIVAFFQVVGWSRLKAITVIGGGSVYLLIYALTVNAAARLKTGRDTFAIGSPRLEAIALYLVWLVFALAFVPRIVSGWPAYTLLGVAAVAALVLRIMCLIRYKRTLKRTTAAAG